MSSIRAGHVIGGDFRVIEPLAAGGMGAVYVVEQVSTGRRRALKVMAATLVDDERSRERFVEEARVGSRIDSEHVVEVIAAGVDEGTPWLAMELLEGEDLQQHVQSEGPLSLDRVIDIYDQLTHALSQAHARGIIHRDLKPENLFLTRARRRGGPPVLKILDFGIASFVASNKTAATATSAIGSPLWLSPEQATPGAQLRPSVDVWALGLIAFYLLTGRSYWRSANVPGFSLSALIAEIVAHPLVPATERAGEIGVQELLPAGFDAFFARCVTRSPDDRLASADEVLAALEEVVSASGAAAPVAEPSSRTVPVVEHPAVPPSGLPDHPVAATQVLTSTEAPSSSPGGRPRQLVVAGVAGVAIAAVVSSVLFLVWDRAHQPVAVDGVAEGVTTDLGPSPDIDASAGEDAAVVPLVAMVAADAGLEQSADGEGDAGPSEADPGEESTDDHPCIGTWRKSFRARNDCGTYACTLTVRGTAALRSCQRGTIPEERVRSCGWQSFTTRYRTQLRRNGRGVIRDRYEGGSVYEASCTESRMTLSGGSYDMNGEWTRR